MRVVLTFLMILTVPAYIYAQGGSNYSGLGMGDIRRTVGATYDAIAGTSIAMPTHHGINVVNPSLLGQITTTRLQAGYRFNQSIATNSSLSLAQNNGEIDGVLGLFSIDTAYKFGMTLGLIPLTSVNYATRHTISTESDGSTVSGTSTRTGQGGTSALVLGAGARVLGNLHVGIMGQAVFGSSLYSDQVVAQGTSNFGIASSTANEVRAFILRTGLYFPVNDRLSFGAVFATGSKGSVNVTNRVVSIGSGTVVTDTTVRININSSLPVTFGFGASYVMDRYRLGADLEISNYSSVIFNPRSDVTLGSSMHASVGISRPGNDGGTSTWLQRWGYHAGLGYDKSYVTYAGAGISDIYGSFGIDFPAGGSATLDAAITAGFRNVSNSSYLQESFMRATVTLSIGESWFKPLSRE